MEAFSFSRETSTEETPGSVEILSWILTTHERQCMPFTLSMISVVSMKISVSSDGEQALGFCESAKRSISLGDSCRGRGLDLTNALKPATAIWSMMVWTVMRYGRYTIVAS